jgi:hypothetical protein
MRLSSVLFAAALVASAGAQAPSNNSCGNALVVFDGINPQPPSGSSGQFFTNVGATNSSSGLFGVECAAAFNKDVWFEYTASKTGAYNIKTCTPSGFTSGTLSQTVVAVYDAADCPGGGSALDCNDDNSVCNPIFGSSRSSVSINLYDGLVYLIRVGTEDASLSGTFYLEVEAPATAPNDTCLGATALSTGANPDSFSGSNPNASTYGCTTFTGPNSDLWYTITGNIFDLINPKEWTITATGAVDEIAIYTGTCLVFGSSFTSIACGTTQVNFVRGNDTYYIRVGIDEQLSPSSLSFTLTVDVNDLPPNDACANGFVFLGGSLPYHPDQSGYLSNVGATTTAGLSVCVPFNSDVWFEYIATSTGMVLVTTDTPAGKTPGTLTDTVLAVFDSCGGAQIACNDDGGVGFLSYLEFYAVQGTHYRIMVADYGNTGTYQDEGDFWFTVLPKFSLALTAPSGVGSFQLNVANGGASHLIFNCMTLQVGAYPYGPFYGIEPTFSEIVLELQAGEPFVALLNAAGAYQFGPVIGAPSGLTLYAVTLEFDLAGQIAGVSNNSVLTIP